jgi:hypothetical protein
MGADELIETDAWGSSLASWSPLLTLLGAFAVIVVALVVTGRGSALERIPNALERLTGIPGWAASAMGTVMIGLVVAGEGFYSDVAWHIALGRDDELFTAPHTSIVVGLGLIFCSAAFGIAAATATRAEVGFRWGALRVPWSMVPLAALGGAALAGFPLDEVWHAAYGVDVTMWSPTHMIMILGASFAGLACWLVLAEARVRPTDSRWARGAHVVTAWLTLQALAAPQGEFAFGVPQFQQMFHPVLVTLAGAVALTAVRIVHGRGWALGITLGSTLLMNVGLFGDDGSPIPTREGGLYVASALAVELAAWLLGTERRTRFALVAGAGVATLGLAGEWWWNRSAFQPWNTNLLPDALVLCLVVGLGGALVGTAFGGVVTNRSPKLNENAKERARVRGGEGCGVPGRLVAAGAAAVVVALVLPLPRPTGDVTAAITLEAAGPDAAFVEVELTPAGAADDARWFQTLSWQGGGLVIAEMDEVGPGRYRSDKAVPVTGRGKALVRLHRGGEMMAAPVYFPADPEIGEPEIPAEDRTVAMAGEREFLLRETTDDGGLIGPLVYGLFVAVLAGWAVAFVLSSRRLAGSRDPASGRVDQPISR